MRVWLPILLLLSGAGDAAAQGPALPPPPERFRIELPDFVLTGVPVKFVRITALDETGQIDRSFNGRPLIEGIRLSVPQDVDDNQRIVTVEVREDAELPPFRNGVLELTTDLQHRRKVYVTQTPIVVDPDSRYPAVCDVTRTISWFSLVPPLLAVVLAIWVRNVVIALFVGVYSGAVVLAHGNFFTGFLDTLDTHLLGEIAPVDDSGALQQSHLMIMLFTMFLGAMVGVMSESGGTHALVGRLSRFTRTREGGQLTAWFLGLVVFFDDYANTLLVGSTMRPVTDRLKISREKLAFLVDSTAAPVAGLAIVSTWVGVEIGYIADTYRDMGIEANVFEVFLATIPYRFYPMHLLAFVWLVAYTGRDYGPMLRAETRALAHGQLIRPDSVLNFASEQLDGTNARRPLVRNALIPLAALLIAITLGLYFTGRSGIEAANRAAAPGAEPIPATVWNISKYASSEQVLFIASFTASIVAILTAAYSRSLTTAQCMDAWSRGAKSMFFPLMILVLAWGVARVCNSDHLNTAGFLVELSDGRVGVSWMPTLAFVLSAGIAFATGSSWSTMALLMPLFISVTHYLLIAQNDHDPVHPLMLGTIGAILAGAIFGDHCSPISDTTVLSSAASGCDHLDHVATQLPYAGSVALVSLVFGYIPVGFGYSPIILLPMGLLVQFLIVWFLGRNVEATAREVGAHSFVPDSVEVDEEGPIPDLPDLDGLPD